MTGLPFTPEQFLQILAIYHDIRLVIVPALWALIGGSAAMMLAVPTDYVLLGAGLLVIGGLAAHNIRAIAVKLRPASTIERQWWRRAFLACGIVSSLVYGAMIWAIRYEGYSLVSQVPSELTAIGAPTRALWAQLGWIYTMLVTAFGVGLWKSAGRNRAVRIVGGLILAYASLGLLWPFAAMHQREVLAAGGGTLSDTLHVVLGGVTVFLMFLAIGFGATAFGQRFRLYSIVTIVVLLTFGALTFIEAPRLQANLPTPWIGLWERINISVFLLWVVVLAAALLQTGTSQERRIMSHASPFKTPEGEARFLAAYDAALKLWPVSYEELDIPTRFGVTHVVAAGPKDAPPLVLLHGYMATSVMWGPNVADFSRGYRVFAIDVMGQPSKSVPGEPIRHATDYAAWLTATLDGLNLDRVSLVGMSFGGWIALKYAVATPERIHSLALLSPGGVLPMVKQFTLRAMLMVFVPARFTVNSFMHWAGITGTGVQPVLDLTYLGLKHFQMPQETMRVDRDAANLVADEELRHLRMPVLLLFGDGEVIYDSAKALDRARRLIPDLEAELIPGCRHDMCFSQSRIVDARVLDFLNTRGDPQARTEQRSVA
jgi:pimeloyl-ACP methyl ester carboxylesterase